MIVGDARVPGDVVAGVDEAGAEKGEGGRGRRAVLVGEMSDEGVAVGKLRRRGSGHVAGVLRLQG
jgi:hypothetical protein